MDYTFDAKDDPFQTPNELAGLTNIYKPRVPTVSHRSSNVDVLHNSASPPFLTKTYDMVDDPATDKILSWSSTNNSFVVWNPPEFSRVLLPKFFKHNNFSSFVRQLNTYGFRKVDPDRWEFANEGFLRDQRHLLKSIHRRKPAHHCQQQSQSEPSLEVGKCGGMEGEIEGLKLDKSVLMFELVRMKQRHQTTEQKLRLMGQRLHAIEDRQSQMMSFLAKAMQNTTFLAQLMQQSDNSKQCDNNMRKRRCQSSVNKGLGGVSGTPNSEIQLSNHQVSSANDQSQSMHILSSSGASFKRVDKPFARVDRTIELEAERVTKNQEEELNSPAGGQGEMTTKKVLASVEASMRPSQHDVEHEQLYYSQMQASVSAIPEDARVFEDRGLGGGECLPEMEFSSAIHESLPREDAETGTFRTSLNDGFWEHFSDANLDSGNSAPDRPEDELFSGSGSGEEDGDYAVRPRESPRESRFNKRNRDHLGFDFERWSLFSNSMKLPVL